MMKITLTLLILVALLAAPVLALAAGKAQPLTISADAETYDARVAGPQILTPPAGPVPAINGPQVYGMTFLAENDQGKDERKLTFVVGDKSALTPPMGWNHWYSHCHFLTDAKIRAAAETMVAMRDLWRRQDAGTVADKVTVRVGSRGCAVFRLVAAKTTEP